MSGLRKRGSGGGSGFAATLKEFDAYAKPLDDFRVKTVSGAAVTLASAIIISLLMISEFVDWTSVTVQPSLVVDKARKEKMQINMNITFPRVPCYLLSVDVMDVAGEHQNDILHDMFKVRLDNAGRAITKEKGSLGPNKESEAVEKAKNITSAPGYCGSCYGGQPPESGCCNTCDEVRRAYLEKGWSFTNPEEVEQCVGEGWMDKMKEQANEGCNVHGHLEVNKVAGNFHFAPGKSFQQSNMHVHDLHPYFQNYHFDFSHEIHSLSFGQSINFQNPLDRISKDTVQSYFMYQYFTKVVGTKYTFLNGTTIYTNQFSATEHERDLSPRPGIPSGGLPGVFFNFEISPMLVVMTEYRKPFTHFLTDVCAIVGGIFTVAGLLDSFIYTAEKTMKKKMDLGKAM
ncbi:endoplasmic reticulum vesicle transporter-domain-containing protein [Cladochytrium replicatum]|nr:endoplasmic reticulum vesicle transporter-domain-containing protein [Cladochytrium replicatum]KAI8800757.1 endoplasmic reticulum vesicle transporter-domain-containing protein [Cladochytrium replicatum]